MFSQTVEYALRAVVHLASAQPAAQTTEQIAAATRVPRSYLAKVLQGLSRAGLVTAQRGLRGGTSLARPADELTIWSVVEAVEPFRRIRTCPLGLASHGTRLCPLHRRLDDAMASVEAALSGVTLAELLAEPTESIPLCDFPVRPAQRPQSTESSP